MNPESRSSPGVGRKNGGDDENGGDRPLGALRRCKTEPEARGGAGGGGKIAWYDEGTPHARAPEQGDNAENGSGNGNRDDGRWGPCEAHL